MSNISVEPQTIVHLCKTGLQRDNGHQLTFASSSAQSTYFLTTKKKSFTDFTYVRDNNSMTVGENIDIIRDCNYLMYQNKGFTNKWFYAFITDMEYVNENCTRVFFETDSWQTFMFDFDVHKCFVEREHTNDDTVGANLVPENIETGDYVCYNEGYYTGMDNYVFVIQATAKCPDDPDTSAFPASTDYGGIPMVGGAYITNNTTDLTNIINAYLTYNPQGATEEEINAVKNAVYNVYVVPKGYINNTLSDNKTWERYAGQSTQSGEIKNISKPTAIGSHTVVNKKLLTYPFCYLLVSNNNGMSNVLKYEYFTQTTCTFTIKGVPAVGGSIKLHPSGYKGGDEENGIIAGKFPVCNWINDNYTNWLTQNAVNQKLDALSGVGNVASSIGYAIGSAGQGNIGGAVQGLAGVFQGAIQAGKVVASDRQHQMQAPSASGQVNGGDINVCSKKNGFFFYGMSVSAEMAEVIDNYFSMYGYQTNKLKYPNLGMTLDNVNYKGRENWNYVKTIGCTFDAKTNSGMSQKDVENIRNMFDNGVTLWHTPANMYNYNVSNNIVS